MSATFTMVMRRDVMRLAVVMVTRLAVVMVMRLAVVMVTRLAVVNLCFESNCQALSDESDFENGDEKGCYNINEAGCGDGGEAGCGDGPEHDDLGGHGGHLVGEAVLVDPVHVRREGVLPVRLPLPLGWGQVRTLQRRYIQFKLLKKNKFKNFTFLLLTQLKLLQMQSEP